MTTTTICFIYEFLFLDCTAPFVVGIKTNNLFDGILGDLTAMPPVADPALATVIPRGRVSFFHKVEIFLEQREVAFLSPSKI